VSHLLKEKGVDPIFQMTCRDRNRLAVQSDLLSAWVLGLLPIGVASYMMLVNPSYLEVMWHDDGGKNILLTALMLQCLGGILLWRMVRSI
jgi:Flp pilus assembly protein TadB